MNLAGKAHMHCHCHNNGSTNCTSFISFQVHLVTIEDLATASLAHAKDVSPMSTEKLKFELDFVSV